MTNTLANGYSFESTQRERELSKEYQHDGLDVFQKSLHSCAMDESNLSIGRVKNVAPTTRIARFFLWDYKNRMTFL